MKAAFVTPDSQSNTLRRALLSESRIFDIATRKCAEKVAVILHPRILFLLLCAGVVVLSGCRSRFESKYAIPNEFVGVWIREDQVIEGEVDGGSEILAIDTDGLGALVTGSPPIGIKLSLSFDRQLNGLRCKFVHEGGELGETSIILRACLKNA